MRRAFVIASCLSLLLPLVGCESGSTRSRAVSRSGLLIEADQAQSLGYGVAWAADLGLSRSSEVLKAKVLDDLIVTLQRPDNVVSAVELRSGEVRWRTATGPSTQPIIDAFRRGDRVYVSSGTEVFTINANTGDILSIADLRSVVSTGSALYENYAIFGGIEGTIFAHDIDAGRDKWSYDLTGQVIASPVISGANVFVTDTNGAYAMLTVLDGSLLWRGRTFGPITATPVVDRFGVFVPSQDQTLYALDRADGTDKWQYRVSTPLTRDPSAVGTKIYLPVRGRGLVALDAMDGSEQWVLPAGGQPIMAIDERLLLLQDESLSLIRLEDGAPLVEAWTRQIMSVLEGPDQSAILVNATGEIVRLNRNP